MYKKLKEIIKNVAPAAKPLGVNPSDPWSAKAGITEGSLEQYLSSRGINPAYVSRDSKIAHAKSSAFINWKKNHVDKFVQEETDKKDMVCMDIPLLIRVLEFTREDMKTDIELHNMVERLINMRHDVPLDMTHYDEITSNLVKEEVLDESPKEGGKKKFSGMYNPAPKGTFAYDQAMRKKKHDEIEKNQSKDGSGMTSAIDRLEKHLNKEDVYADSQAATQTVGQGISERRKEMSKSARMIKALYKKKGVVKEDMTDTEKEDKSVATYGKKPKFQKTDKEDSIGENKPAAAATMTGGTTLTGEKRDNIEIDPMMRNRPGQPDVTKGIDKDGKKKDK